jgi:hypothetical protein
LLRGSAEVLTKSINLVLQKDIKFDPQVFKLIKSFGEFEFKYSLNFPEKLVRQIPMK